ncbi:alpha/beta fold hydrolase [Uliginosibacterium gangwonense]|uniref:alpha/beta fold hydrolase n=1 Tax=Uliginosibacterium gangwonense TaxID=392736 RepID=UPI00036F49AE|nr:alpha/beta fold hydrolase [Uliginosibacterium gangwonense]
MHFITRDHTRLYYEQTGEGFPLLMLSGLWSDTQIWDKQVDEFKDLYCCIRLEHRGIARSDKWQGTYSYDLHAQDVCDLLDHLKIDKAIVSGVCHGGMTAVRLAHRYPHRCTALVINGTQVLRSGKQSLRFQGWRTLIEQSSFETFYQTELIPSLYSESFLAHNSSRLEAITAGASARMELGSTLSMLDACSRFGLEETELKGIQIPALIMAGDEDAFVLQSAVEHSASLWPHSQYHLFKRCGHFPQREATAEYNRVVKNYLATLTQPSHLCSGQTPVFSE